MNPDERKTKQALSQLVGQMIDTCEAALSEHRSIGTGHGFAADVPLRFIAAEEAESLMRSFAASDRRVLAEELVPCYEVLGSFLARYAGDVEAQADREVQKPELLKKVGLWKYTPSNLFTWLTEVDRRQSTDFSAEFAELALDVADIVCRLDGHIDKSEQHDIRIFAETLDEAFPEEMSWKGKLDLSARRWDRPRSNNSQRTDSAGSSDVDDLLDVLLTSRTTSATAAAKDKLEAACAGCAKVGVFETQYCDACAEPVPAVILDLRYLEVEDSVDDGEPVGGPCGCGAAFLHSRRSSSRAWLDCHHCGNQYRIRPIPRHRLQTV